MERWVAVGDELNHLTFLCLTHTLLGAAFTYYRLKVPQIAM